jgi:hypothetical protein
VLEIKKFRVLYETAAAQIFLFESENDCHKTRKTGKQKYTTEIRISATLLAISDE